MNEDKLTTQSYWEGYYSKKRTTRKHIESVCSFYDKFWNYLFEDEDKDSIIEIGGYPGRYLAYLASKYQLKPTSLDFNSDKSQIEATFKAMNVEEYNIIQEDFTTYKPEKKYDYVISNGFIEHFDNFDEILDKHLLYLKPNGRLLVMIPNKRYLRKLFGLLCDSENLKAHNLNCMNLKVFNAFAERNNLKIVKIQYFGGFPYSVHQRQNTFQKIISKSFRLVFKKINPILIKHPSKYLSASIIAIYQKENG